MPAQNRYRIAINYKDRETEEWTGWRDNYYWRKTADNWQDAIQECIDDAWSEEEYTVVAETLSGDGQSGITEIDFGPTDFWAGLKVKATLVED